MIFRLDDEWISIAEVKTLSNLYHDNQIRRFRTQKNIRNLNARGRQIKPINLSKETRLVFLGHGSALTFGSEQMTPEGLAQDLIDKGISKDNHVVIDLLGCSIGDERDPNMSYAHQLAAYFYHMGYRNIQVNVLNSLAADNPETIGITSLYAPKGFTSTFSVHTKLTGLSEARHKRYEHFLRNDQTFLAEAVVLFGSKKIFSTSDIKSAFDHNLNFQITSKTINIPYYNRLVMAAINNRIAQLQMELDQSKFKLLITHTQLYRNKQSDLTALSELRTKLMDCEMESVGFIKYARDIIAAFDVTQLKEGKSKSCISKTQMLLKDERYQSAPDDRKRSPILFLTKPSEKQELNEKSSKKDSEEPKPPPSSPI